MPRKSTLKRARQDKREGKSASTQAGEFVREEIEHIREGKHGARSAKQAIAIGLSKARRAGVDLPPPKKGEASAETRRKAQRDNEVGAKRTRKTVKKAVAKKAVAKKVVARKTTAKTTSKQAAPSKARSRATTKALKREGRAAASKSALSKQAKTAARKRTAADRSAAAKKAARTKGAEGRSEAARKAARTRARNEGPRRKHNGASTHA